IICASGKKPIFSVVFFPRDIVCVKQFMRFLSAGLAEKFLIKLFNRGIFMRFPERLALIFAVKCSGAKFLGVLVHKLFCGDNRLAAACHAASGTAHDLNKVVLALASFYRFKQLLGITGSVSN